MEQVSFILDQIAFRDRQAAAGHLEWMLADCSASVLFEGALPHLIYALHHAASPDRALLGLARLLEQSQAAHLVKPLAQRPEALCALLTIMGASQLLIELLVRNPSLLNLLDDLSVLVRPKDAGDLVLEAQNLVEDLSPDDALNALRLLQQQEMFRIGSCDLLGMLDLTTVTTQLSHLADTVVQSCLAVAAQKTHIAPDGFTVMALGKLGGAELNYSSDIDLLFLAQQDAAHYYPLAEALIEALASRTAHGFLYRVDMRLRPWGGVGPLVITCDGYRDYVRDHARLWERQALLKVRPIAGERALGQAMMQEIRPLIFVVQPDHVRQDVRQVKRRIENELRRKGRQWGEVKSGVGSIRDIEFVTQYLQLILGAEYPQIHTPNTLEALARISRSGLLAADDYRVLTEGYLFLRPVEHYLQLMHGRQTHALPTDTFELSYLGRRLGFAGDDPADDFLARYEQHAGAIRSVFERHLEETSMPHTPSFDEVPNKSDLARHLERMAPSYADLFTQDEIRRHVELAERLGPGNLVEVEGVPLDAETWQVTIVALDYPGELAMICGLLTAYGCDIREGSVFTYEPAEAGRADSDRRKIVDVFSVHSPPGLLPDTPWVRYESDLAHLLELLDARQVRTAQGELARQVAHTVRETRDVQGLQPVLVEIDNESSDRYTVLYIEAPDTPGFLYEFTNALAVLGHYVGRMTVDSHNGRARDTLYLTDRHGNKIVSPEQQRELRAATVLVKHFTHLLPNAPDPERAMNHFQGFVSQLLSRDDWPSELASLTRPRVLSALARLLGVSDFLWTDFLRLQHENLFPIIRDVEALEQAKSKCVLREGLEAEIARYGDDDAAQAEALNAFKDREIFRVDMRHIQGYMESFGAFSHELSDVADVVVEAAYRLCNRSISERYGLPRLADETPSSMAVFALGKLGGREIGYASDIELMFVYDGNGQTDGVESISTPHYYEELVRCFLRVIRARREGIFEIDLRLRPYGESGSLAVSVEAFRRYFRPGGPAWAYERQALVRMRFIAGDKGLADEIVALRDTFVYRAEAFDPTAIRAMRERQLRHLVAGGTINAKFSRGGLVDAEYLVQGLQIRHGAEHPDVRLANTQQAMAALHEAGLLSSEDYVQLRDAHIFLRHLIDALRMVRGNARDLTVPPQDSDEFAFLARRCGYGGETSRLREDLVKRMYSVQALLDKLL